MRTFAWVLWKGDVKRQCMGSHVNERAAVTYFPGCMRLGRCVRNKSAGLSDVGFGNYGDKK